MTFKVGDRVKFCCDMTRIDCHISDDYVIKVKNISYDIGVLWIEWTTKHGDINGIWVKPEYVTHDYQYIRQRKLNNLLR